jgi:hypothetical protein
MMTLLTNETKVVQLQPIIYISYREKTNTNLVEGNLVSAKRISSIPGNQKVHMTIEFDCKQ